LKELYDDSEEEELCRSGCGVCAGESAGFVGEVALWSWRSVVVSGEVAGFVVCFCEAVDEWGCGRWRGLSCGD